jgi:beta-glucosidase
MVVSFPNFGIAAPFVPTLPLPATENSSGTVKFPQGFLWGAASAAQQVEGAVFEDGRAASIWDAFSRKPGAIAGGANSDVACDHYHRMPQDVALMKSMNLNAYRFSTSWCRIMTDGRRVNPKGIDFYSRLVDELLAADVEPFLTLYHWDLPQTLQDAGGWPNRDTAYRFLDYAMATFDALNDRVTNWLTINEPWCASYLSYIGGEHAPGHHSKAEGIAAAHHLLLAHGLAAQEMKDSSPNSQVGIAINLWPFDAADVDNPLDVEAAIKKDGTDNRAFLDPVFRGVYPPDVMRWYGNKLSRVVRDGDLEIISTDIDTFGINYYNGSAIKFDPATGSLEQGAEVDDVNDSAGSLRGGRHWTQNPSPAPQGIGYQSRGLPVTGMGWDVQPEGLTRLLIRLQRDYTGPRGVGIYVTENGAAYKDVVGEGNFVDDSRTRQRYLDLHLRALKDAIDSGVDVRGYFAWCLMDNFEWSHGYTQRFGIVHNDFATQARTLKASGKWYSQVALTNTVPEAQK